MKIIETVAGLHQYLQKQPINSIGFVPTMGNLHDGHISLVSQANKLHDCVVASIYVNRKQFNRALDFNHYPNTFEDDVKKLEAVETAILFAPNENEMYPGGMEQTSCVIEPTLANVLCGATRPGHFEGVTTVITKFLNIIQPDSMYLGEKDYQQYLVLKKMVADLFIPCSVEVVPTYREDSGLAMSSRNNMLTKDERLLTAHFRRPLATLKTALIDNSKNYEILINKTTDEINALGFQVDYLECRHNKDLTAFDDTKDIRQYRVYVAAFLGKARLIDNIQLV